MVSADECQRYLLHKAADILFGDRLAWLSWRASLDDTQGFNEGAD